MPRKDKSVLGNLPLHQQDTLISWLVEDRLPFADVLDRLAQDWMVKTSETALNNFWHRYCAPRLLRISADAADGFAEQAGGLGKNWSAPSKALIRQKHFELLSSPFPPEPKELALYAQMVAAVDAGELERDKLKTRRQETALRTRLKLREQRLQREKFENSKVKVAEQTKKLREAGAKITDAERQAIVAEIDRAMGIM